MKRISGQSPRRTASAKRRPAYSNKFLAQYGRSLTPAEIRLLQAFRALTSGDRSLLLRIGSQLVIRRARGGAR